MKDGNSAIISLIVIVIGTIINLSLNDENKINFGNIFSNGVDLGIIDFFLVDSIDKIKKFELESWFKNSVNSNYGIWIGNGINDQYTIKINQKIVEMRDEIPENFCFVIKHGKAEYIKYVEEFNLETK